MITLTFLLLFCHLLGDFSPLSTRWMLKAKDTGSPALPILAHASVHGALMLVVLIFYVGWEKAFPLVAYEIVTHFIIDVLKGKSNVWFPQLRDERDYLHWFVFGVDQLLHQSVILVIAWAVYNA